VLKEKGSVGDVSSAKQRIVKGRIKAKESCSSSSTYFEEFHMASNR
jgi:hypothetical protein